MVAHREIQTLVPKVREEYKDKIHRSPNRNEKIADELEIGMVPIGVKAILSEEEPSVEANQHAIDVARKLINAQERNEHEALEEG